jgi:hypothetical protein
VGKRTCYAFTFGFEADRGNAVPLRDRAKDLLAKNFPDAEKREFAILVISHSQ